MFRRQPTFVNVSAPTQYVTRETVERRAPTDESVRLLMEMEKAAKEKLELSMHVGDNSFECTVNLYRDLEANGVAAVVLFSLNGKRERCEIKISESKIRDGDSSRMQNLFESLRDETAKAIATKMLAGSFAQIAAAVK